MGTVKERFCVHQLKTEQPNYCWKAVFSKDSYWYFGCEKKKDLLKNNTGSIKQIKPKQENDVVVKRIIRYENISCVVVLVVGHWRQSDLTVRICSFRGFLRNKLKILNCTLFTVYAVFHSFWAGYKSTAQKVCCFIAQCNCVDYSRVNLSTSLKQESEKMEMLEDDL